MLEKLFNWKWILGLLLPIAYLIILSIKHFDRPIAYWAKNISPATKEFFGAITHLGLGYIF